MKLRLYAAPWCKPELTSEASEAVGIFADNLWAEASVEFYALRDAKLSAGLRAPKGMQRTLNDIIQERFSAAGWQGDSGYYFKGSTWLRVTFRHQMSIGSDIVDAQKVCMKSGIQLAMLLAADRATLNIISPNDAAALVSFEKLQREIIDLDGVIDIPLLYGRLTPLTHASRGIEDQLFIERPRDITIPQRLS